jgi:tetrahydromethanopterin S-methyltransferase subunit G
MARIEGAFDQINECLGSIDRRFESVDRRFDRIDSRFNWLTGIVVGTWITMMATQITTILTIVAHG